MSRLAFLFPGQGSQTVGMLTEAVLDLPVVKKLFQEAEEILGYDLLALCQQGPAEVLNRTDKSQPAIFVSSLAALARLRETEPSLFEAVVATAGLSLGEYTALVFAEALSFQEALTIVKIRGEAMQQAAELVPSGMIAVIGPTREEVAALVESCRRESEGVLAVANELCPGNTVVSGENRLLELLTERAGSLGYRLSPLTVAGAFHTTLMSPAEATLAEAVACVTFKVPRIPIWSNVTAEALTDPASIKSLLVQQLVSPVRWEDSLRSMLNYPVTAAYEIGPGKVLSGLMKRIQRSFSLQNVSC